MAEERGIELPDNVIAHFDCRVTCRSEGVKLGSNIASTRLPMNM